MIDLWYYRIIPCDIGNGDQFTPEFLRINPNNRMPAMVDHDPIGGGAPLSVFESGAILFYLAEKSGRFWPAEPHAKYEVVQWVVWQMANQGPKIGEAGHFRKLSPEYGDQSYARRRFNDETNRLYGVLNNRLYDRPWLAGDDYTIADMAAYPWTIKWRDQGEDIDEFPYFKRWFEAMGERPGIRRGLAVGAELEVDRAQRSPEEEARRRKLLYNQRARPVPARSATS
jgi:GST-like protein